jgi:ABC-type uncharacterized transport system substrate-binding protein
MNTHRALVIALAERHRLPVIYGAQAFVKEVQHSAKFEFVINRKTAKALGLDIPLWLRVAATELID